jgi:surface protein
MKSMFNAASALDGNISIFLGYILSDRYEVMFWGAKSFNQEDLPDWDTSAVTTMQAIIYEAPAFDWGISRLGTLCSCFVIESR